MKEIVDKQINLLKKISLFYLKNNSLSQYFCSFGNNLGFFSMKLWISNKNILIFLISLIKEFLCLLKIHDYQIKNNLNKNKKFKNLILTWGDKKSIKSQNYYDKYFDTNTNQKSTLWLIVYSGNSILKKNNLIYITEKKISFTKRVFNFLIFFFETVLTQKISIHNFSNYYFLSYKFKKIFKEIIEKQNSLEKVFIPYESQPFQNQFIKLIKNFNKNIKTIGYIHSFPAFPSHLIKKKNSPDFLILNSTDQFYTFKKFMNWNKNELKVLPSLRFKKNNNNLTSKTIFLPINFYSEKIICSELKNLSLIFNISKFKIRNHPTAYKSKKHNKIIIKLQKILDNCDEKNLPLANFSIYIGSTSSIIESLLKNIKTIHILEDPVFELYSRNLWPSIKSHFINKRIVEYELLKSDNFRISNKNFFNKYMRI